MPTTDEIRQMLAESIAADAAAAAESVATSTVTAVASDAIRDAVALLKGAESAGLPIDLAAVLAAAVDRATPAAPETVAAVVAPDPVAPAGPTDGRRTRRRIERSWADVESGSIWRATLAGASGRVKVTVDADGNGATFVATTGNRGSFRSPSRAVQSACGNPAGAGRKGEATVNGFLALTLATDAAGAAVTDGPTLDSVTAV